METYSERKDRERREAETKWGEIMVLLPGRLEAMGLGLEDANEQGALLVDTRPEAQRGKARPILARIGMARQGQHRVIEVNASRAVVGLRRWIRYESAGLDPLMVKIEEVATAARAREYERQARAAAQDQAQADAEAALGGPLRWNHGEELAVNVEGALVGDAYRFGVTGCRASGLTAGQVHGIRAVLRSPEVAERMVTAGILPDPMGGQ